MLPIAALAYEIIRWGGRHEDNVLAKILLWPGLFTQRLTTREPDDSQIEVALEALRAVLARELGESQEENGSAAPPSNSPLSMTSNQ